MKLFCTVFIACLNMVTSRPTKNTTTIVNAGQDVPITLNNYIYCSESSVANRGKLAGSLSRVRNDKTCPLTEYRFSRLGRVDDFMRVKTPIPDMEYLTVCASFHTGEEGRLVGTILSYAIPENVNTLIIIGEKNEDNPDEKAFLIWLHNSGRSNKIKFPVNEMVHFCVAYNAVAGVADLYLNGYFYDKNTFDHRGVIQGGGVLLIGQEQDLVGSNFDPGQSFHGKLANFMMWDRMLSSTEIESLGSSKCGCIDDYIVALQPEVVELYGGVAPGPLETCPNNGIKLVQ